MEAPNTITSEPGEVRYLVSSKRHQARKPMPVLRLIGNFLIMAGILLLLGIGGWYGFTMWSNQQQKEQFVAEGVIINPPVEATALPTAPPIVIPDLAGGTIATEMLGIANNKPPVVDSSPPIHLSIPSVKIDTKVVPVSWTMIPAPGGKLKSEWQVADYAVGHHAGSANPGQPGNVVLSGHVDYKGQVFKDLDKAQKGDEVVLHTEKGQYVYVITERVLVKEEGVSQEEKERNARYMNQTPDPTLTMITCWPYGIDDHRLIMIAKPYQSALTAQSEFTIR
jgi:sortase A